MTSSSDRAVSGRAGSPLRRVTCGVLASAALLVGGCENGGAGPHAAETTFDATLADSLVERQLAFGPRVPGSEAHSRALEWMTAYLGERAATVERDSFTHVTQAGDTLRLANVFARFNPEASQRILLAAHWDSRPVAEKAEDPAVRGEPIPGANDGASGVAVLLAVADALAADPPAIGVDILLTDGEDWGHDPETFATDTRDMFLGARHFAATRGETYRPLFAILLDLVGASDPIFPQEGFSVRFAPEVVRRVWDVAAELGYADVFVPRQGSPISDDHVPLNEAGIRTIDIIEPPESYPWWHTPEDSGDKISPATLGMVGDVVLTIVRRQGGGS